MVAVLATELSKSRSFRESSIAAFVLGDRTERYSELLGSEAIMSSMMAYSSTTLYSERLSFAPNSLSELSFDFEIYSTAGALV